MRALPFHAVGVLDIEKTELIHNESGSLAPDNAPLRGVLREINCGPCIRIYKALARTQASVNQSQRTKRSKTRLRSTASGRVASPPCTAVPTALESHDWGVLQEMFLASRGQFLRMAYVVLRNREDAEDALQNALISAYKHLRSFEGRSALKTWFTRVVLNGH